MFSRFGVSPLLDRSVYKSPAEKIKPCWPANKLRLLLRLRNIINKLDFNIVPPNWATAWIRFLHLTIRPFSLRLRETPIFLRHIGFPQTLGFSSDTVVFPRHTGFPRTHWFSSDTPLFRFYPGTQPFLHFLHISHLISSNNIVCWTPLTLN